MENILLKPVIIDLDEEPIKRYRQLVKKYDIKSISKNLSDVYEDFKFNIPFFDSIISTLTSVHKDKIMYYDEIKYWSELLELDFHKVMIMQLLYELNSACTTFVIPISNIRTMFRTMDWAINFLKEITYQAIFIKNGKPIFEAVCWLGSVGIFTAKSLINDYSLAINYRRVNNMSMSQVMQNYLLTINMNWPVSYLVRNILENEFNYEKALFNLSYAKTISPVYYIINNFNEKATIIRRISDDKEILQNDILIQTNCDDVNSKIDIMDSHARIKMLEKILEKTPDINTIINTINKSPITNLATIYFSIISKNKFTTTIINTVT